MSEVDFTRALRRPRLAGGPEAHRRAIRGVAAFQIAGKPFDEAGVMRIDYTFEQGTAFHRQRRPITASMPSHR